MPLKAPAEKAILGANQFKFQLTQDRKACAALTSLAVHEIAVLIIWSCTPSNPAPAYTRTHTDTHPTPVFQSPMRGSSHFRFLLKAIECDNGSLYCKWLGCIFTPRLNEPGNTVHLCPCVSFSHAHKHASTYTLYLAFKNTPYTHPIITHILSHLH